MSTKRTHDYDVATVRKVFDLLAANGLLESFLAACQTAGHKLAASEELVALARAELDKLPGVKTPSTGNGCPACPPGT